MTGMQKFARYSLGLLACLVVPSVYASPFDGFKAELSVPRATDGSVVFLKVTAPEVKSEEELDAEFEGVKLPFYTRVSKDGSKTYEAVLGVPYAHKPGQVAVSVRMGDKVTSVPFEIIDGQYRSEQLKVDPKFTKLKKKDLERAQREAAEAGAVYKIVTRERMWDGLFRFPVANIITSVYGTKRMFNGEMQSFHAGIDMRARMGSPIRAAAPGVVRLSKSLFFSGNSIIIDHGYGVFTTYFHMNKLKVRVGQTVQTGTIVGLAGMTGRSSGPHLHWGSVIHGVKINPVELTKVMN
jgi:murein DD-endopeptidase MepM/ murein hydrolase activator NlpD